MVWSQGMNCKWTRRFWRKVVRMELDPEWAENLCFGLDLWRGEWSGAMEQGVRGGILLVTNVLVVPQPLLLPLQISGSNVTLS